MTDRGPRAWLPEADQVDKALYRAIATTPTPLMDGAMRRLSSAADYSRLSLSCAALLATTGLALVNPGVTSRFTRRSYFSVTGL